jgi:lipopolysaccharide/colanic/teichoic acid biosynthesis glycosyltransferase/CheY-like chemotaxis protein
MSGDSLVCRGRILVVDDEPTARRFVSQLLRKHGYEVRVAAGGDEAIAALQQWPPSLVLLDVYMPGTDGLTVLRRIREKEEFLYLPVLLLTGMDTLADKRLGFQVGADDYVTKPFNQQELLLRVEAHLRRCRVTEDIRRFVPERSVRVPLVLNRRRSGVFRKSYQIGKRLFDLLLVILAMPFALSLMAVIALAVRLDSPGPVLFTQNRTGKNGHRFKMLKFRTMVSNAECLKPRYAHLNELSWPDFKIANDPRMTRVGRFLRRSSLDELPQLFNILRGDMSLVGPRPTSFEASTYELWQTERLEVRPGLTGLWQVVGRAEIDFYERAELDIEYIERQSWRLDLQILWQTLVAVVQGRGAA